MTQEEILNAIETGIVAFMDHSDSSSKATDVTREHGKILKIDNVNLEINSFNSEEDFLNYIEKPTISCLGVKTEENSMFNEVDLEEKQTESKNLQDEISITLDQIDKKISIPSEITDPIEDKSYDLRKSFIIEGKAEEVLISVYEKNLENYFRIIKSNQERGIWKEETSKKPDCLNQDEGLREIKHN